MDYTASCGIAKWTILHIAELQNGLYGIMRKNTMGCTSSCGVHRMIVSHYAEITVRTEKII